MKNTNFKLKQIEYKDLNSKQKERYNFQKLAGILADYGFSSIKLDDDWQGADFIANHIDGETFLKVQLKGRLTFDKKYEGKNIFIAFRYENEWYLFEHDELLKNSLFVKMKNSLSWKAEGKGTYSWKSLNTKILQLLEQYKLEISSKNELEATNVDE